MDSVPYVGLMMCGVAVVIFLAIRQFWLWYFGASRIIALLESIDESLQHLPAVQEYRWRKSHRQAA